MNSAPRTAQQIQLANLQHDLEVRLDRANALSLAGKRVRAAYAAVEAIRAEILALGVRS